MKLGLVILQGVLEKRTAILYSRVIDLYVVDVHHPRVKLGPTVLSRVN